MLIVVFIFLQRVGLPDSRTIWCVRKTNWNQSDCYNWRIR